ncbi:response regulator [Sulfurimonas sp.]|uniref:response regulator n=1 Tax=Sulfurimonas sp. TaxID=2022749 RepID=UPI003569EDC1
MSKKVLIVDDSSVMRMTVSSILKESGYEVIEADNGQSGFDKAMATPVDLIISDVNMPVMDGLSFVRLLKEQSQYRFVPIIMLTTVTGQSDIEAGKAAGVKAWMVKPFDKAKLLGAVAKLLG